MVEIICYGCGRGEKPENTIEAIRHCQEINPEWRIEIDIQMSKDEEIVLFHDHNTKKITGIKRDIRKMNYDEIKMLNAGFNFSINGEFTHRKKTIGIPTLKSVFNLFPKAKLVLDIHSKNLKAVDKIIEIIEIYGVNNKIVIVSHYDKVIQKFKGKRPNWIYGAAVKEGTKIVCSAFIFLDYFFPLKSDILILPVKFGNFSFLRKRVLNHVLKRNKKIWVWQELWMFSSTGKKVVMVNSLEKFTELKQRQVDGVFTDSPWELNKQLTAISYQNQE
ncbi:glycerophosphodiester phosphodiesterase family protein [Flavivirga jejuensis]|uniref:Glycerophosphodiester phosphodiesterase family protein n=1 Tax=Flavivirga jejuensis TaxID=870487 RepID=A0ABT8WTE0_9FLAO|nr:glycerophosphodiester phosphodiesterase family protein [Flavivirga jejuensis]MDO5976364.1 glycerophosphodiester phosphodiesterase family protein [Flavivirga jejuensis]